jgi:hypothetical protein
VTVTLVCELIAAVVAATEMLVAPEGTDTVPGTGSAEGLELNKETEAPAGAGPFRYTVKCAEEPAATVEG